MTYRIISTFDGSTETCTLTELSQQLKLNSILAELGVDGTLIDCWPIVHETLVTFAVEFAEYALKNYAKKKSPEADTCIALTKQWLKNNNSVSNEELRAAADAADADAAATDAAYAAAAAADAADAAADAADADAATYAAADAAYAAAAAGKSREAELIRQGQFIVEYLKAAATVSSDSVAA